MKKHLAALPLSFALLAVLCGGGVRAGAQTTDPAPVRATKTLSGASQSLCLTNLTGQSSVAITVTGTFSGTLTFQSVGADGRRRRRRAYPYNSVTPQTTTTAPFSGFASLGSARAFCVAFTAYTSGSVVVTLNATQSVARVAPAASGAPGTTGAPGGLWTATGTSPIVVTSPSPGVVNVACSLCLNGTTQTIAGAKTFTGAYLINNPSGASNFYNVASGTNPAFIYNESNAASGGIPSFYSYDLNTSPGSLEQTASVASYAGGAPGVGYRVTDIESVTAGATSGNYGGAMVLHTKIDGGGDIESEVLTPGGHAYFPGAEYFTRVSTGACTAFVVCGTHTFTFAHPFQTTSGGAAVPECSAPGFMDESESSIVWLGNIVSPLSSTSVTYNYEPTVATSGSTIDIYITCWVQSF